VNAFAQFSVLFADRSEMLRDLGSGFRGERAEIDAKDVLMFLAAALVIAFVIWLLARFAAWRENRTSYHNPKQLFRRLSSAHSLSLSERKLLLKAARQLKSSFPASLFLRPDMFDSAATDTDLAPRADELEALKRKLFLQR
jgi:hypothetical protein